MDVAFDGSACGLDQFGEFDGGSARGLAAAGRFEFQCAHAAVAHVGQSVERSDVLFLDAVCGHPCIDQAVAEIVGERISQHSGQAFERQFRQVGEDEGLACGSQGHFEGRQLDASSDELGVVLEGVITEARIEGDCADAPAPDSYFDDRHGFVHFLPPIPARCALPRFGGFKHLKRADGDCGREAFEPLGMIEGAQNFDQ